MAEWGDHLVPDPDVASRLDEQIAYLVSDSLMQDRVRPLDEVVDHVADALGVRDPDVVEGLATLVEDHAHGGAVRLLDDWVVAFARLVEGLPFTHRLSQAEIDADTIDLAVDLVALQVLASVDGGLHRPTDATPLFLRDSVEFVAEWGGEPVVHHSLSGPEGWLAGRGAGDLVVLTAVDGYLSVEPAAGVEPISEVVELLADPVREAMRDDDDFDDHERPARGHDPHAGDDGPAAGPRTASPGGRTEARSVPVGVESLLVQGLAEGWWPTEQVLPPIGEVLEAIGLEVRHGLVGEPGDWSEFAKLKRAIGSLMRHSGHLRDGQLSAVGRFAKAFDDFCVDGSSPDLSVVTRLHREHGMGAMCVDEELQRLDPTGEKILRFAAALAAPRGPAAAVVHMIAALGHELAGDPIAAEAAVEAAAQADPRWFPAVDARLGFVEARGLLRDTVNVMAMLREPDDPELVRLRGRLRLLEPDVGRNAPCPCGSGRKFKQCHQGRTGLPDEERVAWLIERAGNWVERYAELDQEVVRAAVESRNPGDGDALRAVLNDMVLFELDGLERFVAARGHLLPSDDAALVRRWLTEERTSLYRVETIADDGTMTLHDIDPLGDGQRFEVQRTQSFSSISAHQLVWCRLLPIGDRWIASGVAVATGLRDRAAMLEAMADRRALRAAGGGGFAAGDGERRTAVAAYLDKLFGFQVGGGLSTTDGEPWILGSVGWHVGDDRAAIEAVLDREFGEPAIAAVAGDTPARGERPGEAGDHVDDGSVEDREVDRSRADLSPADLSWTRTDDDGTVLATYRISGCIGPVVCPGATAAESETVESEVGHAADQTERPDETEPPGAVIEADVDGSFDDEDGLDDDDFDDDDEFDWEAYREHSARIDAGLHGFDLVVMANSIKRIRDARTDVERLFPHAVESRAHLTPARRHHEFLHADEVMESIYDPGRGSDASGHHFDLDGLDDLEGLDELDGLDGLDGDGFDDPSQLSDRTRAEVLAEWARTYEERWLDMEIPALGGHTPRQAAADPDLRPDLLTLLAEMAPAPDEPGTMSTDRIRAALGLDPI